MFNKKIILMLTIFIVSLFAISSINAADNATSDVVSSDFNIANENLEIDDSDINEMFMANGIQNNNEFGIGNQDAFESTEINVASNDNLTIDNYSIALGENAYDNLLKGTNKVSKKIPTHFEAPKEVDCASIRVYLKNDKGQIVNGGLFTYSFGNGKSLAASNGKDIPISYSPNTYRTINLKYDGNSQYEGCTQKITFHIASSIKIENSGRYVDGGMNFPYKLKGKNGDIVSSGNYFVPFGTNTIKITNKFTGETVTKTVSVKKRILNTNDVTISYNDTIEYKVRAADENDKFTSHLDVAFIVDDLTYYATTDDDGYATLKIHLPADKYSITTKYCGVVQTNTINIKPSYVASNYKNLYMDKSVTGYFDGSQKLNFGWEGIFNGYLKIYKGQTLVKSIKIGNSKYVGDYLEYDQYLDFYPLSAFSSVGVYNAKIVDNDGNVLATSTINVEKTSAMVFCDSISAKPGATKYVSARVYAKSSGDAYGGGYVKFNIAGKNYKAKVKGGVAKIKVKLPSKLKNYNCKATFLGDKNVKASSTTFEVITKKTTTSNSVTFKLNVNSNWYSKVKLKTGDTLLASANSYTRQHSKGIIMGTNIDPGQEGQHSTKLIKAKVWYKNKSTGKIITKTQSSTDNGRNIKKFSWISGYTPYKAQVWYTRR